MPRSEDELEQAKRQLIRLLRYRPRSLLEARAHLRQRGHSNRTIDAVLAWAEESALVDDQAFARLWVADRLARRPSGKALLERELREKGVSAEIIERVLAEAGLEEEALARELAAERAERYRHLSEEERRARVFAFLRRRGFSSRVATKVVEELRVPTQAASGPPHPAEGD
ncbi:MAG: RecX family transcriptional regulator [Candidatus Acetothermia bacterium]|jgi:regulatory protein|nr:RecX family transcriptional regulator [Candidatus Acetothermia bacterium]